MEKTKRAAVIPADVGWSDVASLTRWMKSCKLMLRENRHFRERRGHGQRILLFTVTGGSGRAPGLRDAVVIDTPDATLVLQ